METLGWILIGLLVVALFLVIFGSIKNFSILTKISRIFIVPFSSGIVVQFLIKLLPEAEHVLFLTTAALIMISICELCFSFENITFFKYTGRLFFILSLGAWLELFISTFFIYRPAQWLNILATSIYSILLIFTFIISGKNKLHTYFGTLIGYVIVISLHYSAIVTLIYGKRDYSILLTIGASVLLLSYIFYIKQSTKPLKLPERFSMLIRTILIAGAEALITTSTILMIR